MKGYMISAGTYSDYHIYAVFSKEEDAKSELERLQRLGIINAEYDDSRIEEIPLDEPVPAYERFFCTIRYSDGEILEERSIFIRGAVSTEREDSWEDSWRHKDTVRGSSVRGSEIARKVAQDYRAELMAKEEGIA